MYNTVKLHPDHWTLQRYLWQEELDPTKIPKEKVIKTLIYGIKSSGNQSEFALRRIAEMNKEEYPEVNKIIQRNVYVDDLSLVTTQLNKYTNEPMNYKS